MNEIAAKTKEKKINPKTELFKKRWYKFSRSPMSMIGMIVVVLCFIVMLFAQQIAPYPEDAEMVTHMAETFQAPSGAHSHRREATYSAAR